MVRGKQDLAVSQREASLPYVPDGSWLPCSNTKYRFGRGHRSIQGELIRAEPLECDLIHFGLTILKTYVGLVQSGPLKTCLYAPRWFWSAGILNKWSTTGIPNTIPHVSLGLLDVVGEV